MDNAIANKSNVIFAELSANRAFCEYLSHRPDTVVGVSNKDNKPAPTVIKARCGLISLVGSSMATMPPSVGFSLRDLPKQRAH
ncbi:MAG: hypothetical protein FWD80_06060 [Propionibacteriaceae bacterium]|nr:hypothetical protein [Propionibacteriaceae bacterium]